MELFDLVIIVPVREVFLHEIILEPFPHKSSFTGPPYLLEVLPPNGCPSIQTEYGNPCLHVPQIILNLKVLLYPKKPSFNLLSSLYFTIKRRFSLLKFIPRAIPISLFFFYEKMSLNPRWILRSQMIH